MVAFSMAFLRTVVFKRLWAFGVSLTDTLPVSVDILGAVNKMFLFTARLLFVSTFLTTKELWPNSGLYDRTSSSIKASP